jgi:protocatechuate 3,4-dioxygenase beta subunit
MEQQKSSGRRKFIMGIGALGIGGLAAWFMRRPILKRFIFTGNFNPELLTSSPTIDDGICVMTSSQQEGPFYYPSPERANVTEDRMGKPFQLRLQVLRYPECTPIENALVDIWHCDADGVYSGYPEEVSRDVWETFVLGVTKGTFENGQLHVDPVNDSRFLRGMQRTNSEGWVTFDTIVPGWYEGRVPHIHTKIMVTPEEQLTTQFYFREDVLNEIYTSIAPYNKHGVCPMSYENDIVLSEGNAEGLLLEIDKDTQDNNIFTSVGRIGIEQLA